MASSRQHQEAHGIGQIEKQLGQQAKAAEAIQGKNALDQEITDSHERLMAEDKLNDE